MLAASSLTLAGLGDSFLYVYLPANYPNMGLSAFWVGIFLSINRFTRLALNSRIAYYASKFGLKNITIVATIVAAVTTLSYGFINCIFLWLIVRFFWGISFSTLRLSSIIYALEHPRKGISLGLGKSINEVGSLLALLFGPILMLHVDRRETFVVLTILSAIGIPIAFSLPKVETKVLSKKDLSLSFPNTLNMLVALNTFVVEGLMVVLVGHLLLGDFDRSLSKVLIVAGFYLAYRRACFILFSPVSGWLADIWGFRTLFNYTSLFLVAGVSMVAFGYAVPGLVLSFTFFAMNAAVATGSALSGKDSIVKDISDNATWRDIGAACGTLSGSLLLNYAYLHIIFMVVLIPMIAVLTVQFFVSKRKKTYNGIS